MSAHDAAGRTTFLYDSFGSLTNETVIGVAGTNTIERYWDSFGRTGGYALNGTRQTTIGYDPATGRLLTMQVPVEDNTNNPPTPTTNSNSFTWSYLPGSDLKSSLAYPNGLVASWQYDANDQLLQVRNATPTNVISQYDYTYDAAGRRIEIARFGSVMSESRTDAYGYNVRNELISAKKLGGAASVLSTTEYAYQYDDIGNRITSTDLGTNRTYIANNLNQYSSISNLCDSASLREEFIPQFDDDGNQTLIQTSTGIWQVQYNGENRPVLWERIAYNSSTPNSSTPTLITMSFDRMGRRVQYFETCGSVTNSNKVFTYDGYLQIANFDAATQNAQRFIWDPTEPVATRPLVWNFSTFQPFNTSTSYYTHDGNKNVSDLVASSNLSVAAHYEYAPFGVDTAAYNTALIGECVQPKCNPLGFSSEYYDIMLDVMYYNYRHYNTSQGRWMTRDPIEERRGINLVVFAGNTISSFDLLGLIRMPLAPNLPGTPIIDDNDVSKCYLLRMSLWFFAARGNSIGRRIYNSWINGGGSIHATPENFDIYGNIRKRAFWDSAGKTLRKKIRLLPCGETTSSESEANDSYPISDVYAIRGFRLNTKCSIDFRPVCSNYKCCRVVVSGTCQFKFSDEFVFRDKGSFAWGLVDEKTIKMCAERFNWGVGTVYTTAEQIGWKGRSTIDCPEERLRPGWVEPIME